MSLPYHRGQTSSSMNNRGGGGGGGGGGFWGTKEQRVEEANRNLLEEENERRWEELGDQVNMLKALSIDINSEVKSQNKLLDGMGSSFGTATDLFKNTIGKIGVMVTSSSSKHMYYLIGFVVFVFLVIYFMSRSK